MPTVGGCLPPSGTPHGRSAPFLALPKVHGTNTEQKRAAFARTSSSSREKGAPHDRGTWINEALRRQGCCRQHLFHRRAGHRYRLPGPQRRRQVHHHAHDHWPGQAHDRHRDRGRQEVQGPQRPTVHRRRPAGRQGSARIANGPDPPDAAGRVQRHPRQPGGQGPGHDRTHLGGQEAGQGVQPRDGAASGHRRRPPGRP